MSTRQGAAGRPRAVRAAAAPVSFDIDMDSITLDDIEAVEVLLGRPCLQEFSDRRLLTISVIRALITVTQRKRNPSFTMADAGQVKLVDLNATSQKVAANPTRAGNGAR